MMKKLTFVFIFILIALFSAEILSRFVLGLGNPLLIEIDKGCGYRVKPNQKLVIRGKNILINDLGMRNGAVSVKPIDDKIRILCIGDSVTFGGTLSDQSQTYPYLLEQELNRGSKQKYEVLNVSAGGWAIGNEKDFIKEYGIFNSRIVILQFTSSDFFETKRIIHTDKECFDYPVKSPTFAFLMLSHKLMTKVKMYSAHSSSDNLRTAKGNTSSLERNLEKNIIDIEEIYSMVRQAGGELIIVVSGTSSGIELDEPLAIRARKMLYDKFTILGVHCIDLSAEFKVLGGKKLYRDNVHPNFNGNKAIARIVKNAVVDMLSR